MSELTYKCDVLCRIIYLDKTHHKKGTEGDKSGSWSTTLTNHDSPRFGFGSQFCKDNDDHDSG